MGEEEREDLERDCESERGDGVAMETPQRNQINTPVSKFEDSPVFNFLNNLSPLQPAKSVHITQTFKSLCFGSLPSIFTSPHVSSLKESRFLRRHQFSDQSKPEFSSENVAKVSTSDGIIDVAHNCAEQKESLDPRNSVGEGSTEPSYECSKLAIEVARNIAYECNSPDCKSTPCRGTATKCVSELADVSEKSLFGSEAPVEGISQIDKNKAAVSCDWENLMYDAADLLVFESPNDAVAFKDCYKKSLDSGTRFCTFVNDSQTTQAVGAVGSGEQHRRESLNIQPADGDDEKETAHTQDMFADASNCVIGCPGEKPIPGEKIDDEPANNLHRGMRRRCLDFETGSRRKHLDEGSSSMLLIPDGNLGSSDKQLAPLNPGNDSSRCILPGIGLHLNALATTSKDYNVVKHEALASGVKLLSVSNSSASVHSFTTGQEPLNNSLAMTSSEIDIGPVENGALVVAEASEASGYVIHEEFSQNSPKKKRRRSEHGGETESCKRCNCKKSKCLKLYCECFAAGVYCVEPCSCQDCHNKPIHEDVVLATRKQIESRNPLAFAPKVIRTTVSIPEIGNDSSKTPASSRHKRGCNCKKSGCLKKYCECYQGGVGCSVNCRCDGCKNVFGRKDGSALIETEAELEEDSTETCEKRVAETSSQKIVIQNDTEPNSGSDLSATPLQFCRPSDQQPFSSKRKPPRSFLSIGSSSSLYASQRFGNENIFQPRPKFHEHFQTVREDEMPEILQQSGSPSSGVKSSSPNSKRVSPPHCEIGSSSPGRTSSRKLILQSIPTFPSLTPKH